MSRQFLATCVALCFISISLRPLFAQAQEPPSSAEQLLSRFESALRAKKVETILGLVYWQGVSKEMRTYTTEMMSGLLKEDVIKVSLSSVTPGMKDFLDGYTRDGVLYRPNVPVMGVIDVKFEKKGSMQISYGEKEKAFYIAGVSEERIYVPQAKEKFLQIVVGGSNSVRYKGYCNYIKGGKQIKDEFSRKGNRTHGFWGDRITYCKVDKTSPDEEIWLIIIEDSRQVFESNREKTAKPIEYKAKF